jgi:phosphoserine phosphatase
MDRGDSSRHPAASREPADRTPLSGHLPIAVDLDGTLVHTDTMHESAIAAVLKWRALPSVVLSLLGGKAALKEALARHAPVDARHLPYNEALIDWLRARRAEGRLVVLATAAHVRTAEEVARHLGLFDGVMATADGRNLRGATKAAALVERFGPGGFTYVGNDRTDLAAWERAGTSVLVNTPRRVAAQARLLGPVEHEIASPHRVTIGTLANALHPATWWQNLLVFAPLIGGRPAPHAVGWSSSVWAFVALCAVASGIWLGADLAHLAVDRRDRRPVRSPFARGELTVAIGIVLALLHFGFGAALATVAGIPSMAAAYAAVCLVSAVWRRPHPFIAVAAAATLTIICLAAGALVSGNQPPLSLIFVATAWFTGHAYWQVRRRPSS